MLPNRSTNSQNRCGGEPGLSSPEEGRLDPAEVAQLYVDYAESLRAFLIGLLRDRDLATEALQAAFARTMEAGHTADPEKRRGWLFRVAYNEAMALKRRQRIHAKSLKKLGWHRPGSSEKPEDNVSRGETISRVRASLEKLPEEQRTVVRLRIYEEMTFADIAEKLSLPLGTVLTRMRLALQKLQRDIRPEP